MSNYGWTNEDGEPIMDGAAWRFEQQLDMDAQADYEADHFYDNDGEAPCERDQRWCTGGDLDWIDDLHGECMSCGKVWDYDWNADESDGWTQATDPDGAPLYRQGMDADDPVRCAND